MQNCISGIPAFSTWIAHVIASHFKTTLGDISVLKQVTFVALGVSRPTPIQHG